MLYQPEFPELYRNHQRAFHLEVQDAYGVASENEQMRKFLAGEPTSYPPDWQSWDAFVKEVSDAGTQMQRLRVVTEPHTDYTRFLLHHTDRNVAAGENVRYLPRHRINPSAHTADDWWLFDDDVLAWTVFSPAGEFMGGAITTDRFMVDRCIAVRDELWPLGIPFSTYLRDQS